VGSLPDGIAFSPDGSKLVVANEAELSVDFANDGVDPEGSISIIAVSNGVPADTAITLDFEGVQRRRRAGSRTAERRAHQPPWGQRWRRIMEPEFVTIVGRQPDGLCDAAGKQRGGRGQPGHQRYRAHRADGREEPRPGRQRARAFGPGGSALSP
jgi:hypothetical protein